MGIFDKLKKWKGQYDQNRSDTEEKRFVDNFTKIKHLKREKQVLDAKLKVQKTRTQINKEKGRNKTAFGGSGGSGFNPFGAPPAGGGFSLFDKPKPSNPTEKKPSKATRGKKTVINVGDQRITIEDTVTKKKKKKVSTKDPWEDFV